MFIFLWQGIPNSDRVSDFDVCWDQDMGNRHAGILSYEVLVGVDALKAWKPIQ